jgi:hypothetical protein
MTLSTNMRLQKMIETFQNTYSTGMPCGLNDRVNYANYINESYKMMRQSDYGTMINMIGEGRYNEDCGAQILEVDSIHKPTINYEIFANANSSYTR